MQGALRPKAVLVHGALALGDRWLLERHTVLSPVLALAFVWRLGVVLGLGLVLPLAFERELELGLGLVLVV